MKRLLLFCLLAGYGFALAETSDSLYEVYCDCERPDSIRLDAISRLNNTQFLFSGNDSCLIFCELQQELALASGNNKYLAIGYETQAMYHRLRGQYAECREYYFKALPIFEQMEEWRKVVKTLTGIGVTHSVQGTLDSGMIYQLMALSVAESQRDSIAIVQAQFGLGNAFSYLGERDSSYAAYARGYRISQEIGHPRLGISHLLNMATIRMEQGKLDDAYNTFHEVQGNAAAAAITSVYLGLGEIHHHRDRMDSALHYYEKCRELARRTKYPKTEAAALHKLSSYHVDNGLHSEAILLGERGLDLAYQVGRPGLIRSNAHVLYQAYEGAGNHRKAYEMFRTYVQWKDSVRDVSHQKEVVKLNLDHQYRRQEVLDSLAKMEEVRLAEENRLLEERGAAYKTRLQYSGILIFVLLFACLIALNGTFHISPEVAEGLIFLFFILLFEFVLVVMDPFVDEWSRGEVLIKLAINSSFALVLFFAHRYFEGKLINAVVKQQQA